MSRYPGTNTLLPLLRKLSESLGKHRAECELRWLIKHARENIGASISTHQHTPAMSTGSMTSWVRRDLPEQWTDEIQRDNDQLTPVQQAWLRQAISDRAERLKPLQYIIGKQHFGGVNILVRPPVPIPHWETEEFVDQLTEVIASHTDQVSLSYMLQGLSNPRPLNILDACTGSGCVALALGHVLAEKSVRILGVDISDDALQLAMDNLAFNQMLLGNRIQFAKVDLQQPVHMLPEQLRFADEEVSAGWDMIVANPPYVTPSQYRNMDAGTREWEDIRALVPFPPGTTDPHNVPSEDLDPSGMSFVVQLAKLARELGLASRDRGEYLSVCSDFPPPLLPRLVVEIGSPEQAQSARQIMHDHGLNLTEVWKDMNEVELAVAGYFK
ncbi:hypothetical protein IWW39_005941 [Coemansia spiralis]|uniref:Uncharacterized protein n=1 Tax=Coemansia spiralis TaxID=417178 RepID=A0A9W8GEG8_9FUNG|nr:hypothetical protein IWW39_005941 [Coemansia spiralis]